MNKKESFTYEVSNENKENLDNELKLFVKELANEILKLNIKELKDKSYVDLSDDSIKNKLIKVVDNLENNNNLSNSLKKLILVLKKNFLEEKNPYLIKLLKENFINGGNNVINKKNIDDYMQIVKQSVLSLHDIGEESSQKDIYYYIKFLSKLAGKNILDEYPDLKFVLSELLPAISKSLDREKLSKGIDILFQNSKNDILKILSSNELSKQDIYKIRLNFIKNISGFLKHINSPSVASVVFDFMYKIQLIDRVPQLKQTIDILKQSNLDNNTKYEIINYVLSSIHDLSDPNISEQKINNFANNTFNFLNFLSNKIPEDKFKEVLKILLSVTKGDEKINLKDFVKYIKNLEYKELWSLLKSNFSNIVKLTKNLISKGINNISIEDFFYELFKSNILSDISEGIGHQIVEKIREIAKVDVKEILIEGRKKLVGNDFLLENKVNKKVDKSLETTTGKIANTFVDSLIGKLINQLKYEISNGDDKLTKTEILSLLKKTSANFITGNTNLLVDFIEESGYKVDKENIKLLKDFSHHIINHPKFNDILSMFLDNLLDITSSKKNIINSLQEIISDLKNNYTDLLFSKEFNDNVKTILLDMIYSNKFNKNNVKNLVNFLEKNSLIPKNVDKVKFAKFIHSLPNFIEKHKASEILSKIDFKNIKSNDYDLFLFVYKSINDKIKFINFVLDLFSVKNGVDSNKVKLTKQQIDFIGNIVYETLSSCDDISLGETVKKIFDKFGYSKLNNIRVFNKDGSEVLIDILRTMPNEKFSNLLNHVNELLYTKNKLSTKDYMNLIDKFLNSVDKKKLIKKIQEDANLDSKFLLRNFDKFEDIYKHNKESINYLIDNKDKVLNMLNTLKINGKNEEKLVKEYTSKLFNFVNYVCKSFPKNDFKNILDIVLNKKYPVEGLELSGNMELTEDFKSKFKKSFIFNNMWFSLKTGIKFIFNGFNLNKSDVIYDYFSNKSNKENFVDTFMRTLSR